MWLTVQQGPETLWYSWVRVPPQRMTFNGLPGMAAGPNTAALVSGLLETTPGRVLKWKRHVRQNDLLFCNVFGIKKCNSSDRGQDRRTIISARGTREGGIKNKREIINGVRAIE